MSVIVKKNRKIATFSDDKNNGSVVPIYSVHENSNLNSHVPQQVYMTTILGGQKKGPHMHKIRTGLFTCIKGNIKIITKSDGCYSEHFSGEMHDYASVLIPTNVPALLVNLGEDEALVLNMPSPAWRADMNDEFGADFSDCDLI